MSGGAGIAGIVLAAGHSKRFGEANKLLAPFRGKQLLRHAVEAACASRADPVIVTTGADADLISAAVAELEVVCVHAPDHAQGQSASLRAGIAAVPGPCAGALICLGDMPFLAGADLDRLIAAFDPEERALCAAQAGDRLGAPALFGRRFFPELLGLSGDRGARGLLKKYGAFPVPFAAPRLAGIDAEEDLPNR